MIIKTRGKEYYVISMLEGAPDRFICREKDSVSSMKYTVLRLPFSEITPDMIDFLMYQVKNDSFVEFVDYTTDEGYLYVVMSNPDGKDFRELVKNGELSFTERLVMAKKCLEHLFLSDFPNYFIHSALHGGVFKVTDALDVEFEFDLSDFTDFENIGLAQAVKAVAATFRNIFEPELNRVAFDPMQELIDKMNSGAYSNLLDVYKDYEAIFKEWNGTESYDMPSHTKWDKLKAWVKKALAVLKSSVVYLILIVSFLYLVGAIWGLFQPYEQQKVYDKIGDIFIINSVEEETDG